MSRMAADGKDVVFTTRDIDTGKTTLQRLRPGGKYASGIDLAVRAPVTAFASTPEALLLGAGDEVISVRRTDSSITSTTLSAADAIALGTDEPRAITALAAIGDDVFVTRFNVASVDVLARDSCGALTATTKRTLPLQLASPDYIVPLGDGRLILGTRFGSIAGPAAGTFVLDPATGETSALDGAPLELVAGGPGDLYAIEQGTARVVRLSFKPGGPVTLVHDDTLPEVTGWSDLLAVSGDSAHVWVIARQGTVLSYSGEKQAAFQLPEWGNWMADERVETNPRPLILRTFPALAEDLVATADGCAVFTLAIPVPGATIAMVCPP